MRKVTIDEIAKAANVHKSTVSKALNYSRDLNAETAENIRNEARKMGYIKTKAKRDTEKCIGFICPELDDAFFSQVVRSFTRRAKDCGYSCVMLWTGFDVDEERTAYKYLVDKNVSGIVIVSVDYEKEIDFKALGNEKNFPVVEISTRQTTGECDKIWVDEKIGVESAVNYLCSLGHKSFAYIGDKYGKMRLKYYKTALSKRGIELEEELTVFENTRQFECGYNGVEKLLKTGKRWTALIAQYDDIATGAIKRLTEKGIRVPEDCSVIGFDDSIYCQYLTPALTSINSNAEYLSELAFKLLENRINGADSAPNQTVFVKPELIKRGTVSTARKE